MRPVSRNPSLFISIGIVLALGCGDVSWGCEMQPLDRDLDDADKIYDGVLVEISPEGFGFIERNFDAILDTFLDGGLSFEVPADPGDTCPGDCSGQRICNQSDPCPVSAELLNIDLLRVQPNVLRFHADLYVHSGTEPRGPAEPIPARVCQRTIWCNNITCDFFLHVVAKPVMLEVVFDVDPVSNALTFELTDPEIEVTSNDYTISGGATCWIAENLFKGMLTNMINDMLEEQVVGEIEETIDEMTCMPCDYYALGCEEGTRTPGVHCEPTTGWCQAQSRCVRSPLGLTGKLELADLLEDMGLPSTPISILAGVGQRQNPWADPFIPHPNGPLQLRAITGAAADHASPCVPTPSSLPRTDPPPRVDFVAESGGLGYHAALAVSDRFLNKTIYEAYRGGALCLDVGTEVADMISTGLLTAFMPSLGVLTEGRASPMYIALRPKDRPQIHIGKGTYRQEGGEWILDDPLLTVHMTDIYLDFYAFFEERYFRLFTLDVDVSLPLGLEITPGNEIIPIVGELDDMVTRIEVKNSEIVAEDPQILADVIPIIVGLVEPMIAEVLDPIPIPDIEGFRLDVVKMTGIVEHEEPGRHEHLGLFAKLELVAAHTPSSHLPPPIELREVRQGSTAQDGLEAARGMSGPSLVVAVGESAAGPVEWQYRISGGFWSPFQTAPLLEISSPKLLVQGRHVLEVRTRQAGERRTLDAEPARFELIIDREPPRARLLVDPRTGIAKVEASDSVTPTGRLEYAFAVDGAAFGAYGSSPSIELPAGAGLVEARVRDEAGNVAEASWSEAPHAPVTSGSPGGEVDHAGGCASGPGSGALGAILLLALGASLLIRRRAA